MKKFFVIAAAMVFVSAGVAMAQTKFAHVNLTEVVQLMPEMDSARVQIDAASEETQSTYQAMVEEFQTKYQTYQQKANSWTDSVRNSKEQELTQIQGRIQDFEQSAQQELQNLQNQLMAPIYQKAQDAINSIAKAGGYIYVADIQTFLYVDDTQSVDITPQVRTACGVPAGRTLEQLQQELQAKAAAQQQ